MTVWSYVWSIISGVIIGGLVTGGIMFLVEWWKNKNIVNNWLTCLLLEIKENHKKKIAELMSISSYINITYLGPLVDERYISNFRCDFGTFKSFSNNGIKIKDYKLFLKYLDFVLFEETGIATKESYIKQYKELDDEVSRAKLRNSKLFEIKKDCEAQLKELSEIHIRIQRILYPDRCEI